jgi:hypothetical protein
MFDAGVLLVVLPAAQRGVKPETGRGSLSPSPMVQDDERFKGVRNPICGSPVPCVNGICRKATLMCRSSMCTP